MKYLVSWKITKHLDVSSIAASLEELEKRMF